jgi:hypothetical protein
MNKKKFVEAWSKSLMRGTGAVFIGAGLSRGAGYPDWRSLLKDISIELGLDIESEHDLAAVAQFSLNKTIGKRTKLTKLIVDHFPPKAAAPQPFRILARLPIREVWTTNYDTLAELAWSQERKVLDVKSDNSDLGTDKPWAHATLYKMHGSVDHPERVVIATDDYELYRRERPGFILALSGQLVTRQMLFLGFSFTDPNLAHLFGTIRESFRENGPEHYAIVRKPQKRAGKGAAKRFASENARHALWVEDLQRYGIQCVEVDSFDEIDELLQDVELRVSSGSVFVSGSYPATGDPEERARVEEMAKAIGEMIAQRKKRLVSGYGLTVGSAALAGALGVVLQDAAPNLDRSFLLRPFPQTAPSGTSLTAFHDLYRESMIKNAALCVVISGEKESSSGKVEVAEGVVQEAAKAQTLGRLVLPIGGTGGAAEKIYIEMRKKGSWTVNGLTAKQLTDLGEKTITPEQAAAAIGLVIDALDKKYGAT